MAGDKRTCGLCDEPAVDTLDIQNEETGEIATANLCDLHLEKIRRYNRGEEVDWNSGDDSDRAGGDGE